MVSVTTPVLPVGVPMRVALREEMHGPAGRLVLGARQSGRSATYWTPNPGSFWVKSGEPGLGTNGLGEAKQTWALPRAMAFRAPARPPGTAVLSVMLRVGSLTVEPPLTMML